MSQPASQTAAVERSAQTIGRLAAQVAALSRRRDLSLSGYFEAYLPRVVDAQSALGGAVWMFDEARDLELITEQDFDRSLILDEERGRRHDNLLRHIAQSSETATVPPLAGLIDADGDNPTDVLLVAAPLIVDGETAGLVEIFQQPATNLTAEEGYAALLSALAEQASLWLTNFRLRQLAENQARLQQVDAFARRAYASLDPRRIGFVLANEAQRLIECDRVSIALCSQGWRRQQACRIEAISGQESVNQRANVVRHLTGLAQVVVEFGEPLWQAGESIGRDEDKASLPPQVEGPLHEYLEESHAKTIALVPIHRDRDEEVESHAEVRDHPASSHPLGVLIVEQMEDLRDQHELGPLIRVVAEHASVALSRAAEHQRIFLLPLWQRLGKAKLLVRGKALPKTAAALAAATAIVAALVFWPARFDVAARGTLQPLFERDVFVDTPGVVSEVLVDHGDFVTAGQRLVVLSSIDLEVQLAQVLGERQSTKERIAVVDRARHQPGLAAEESNRLAGELATLKEKHDGLSQQYSLLQRKINRLATTSPIDGQVITWNVRQKLSHRPVSAGQALMTVADVKGAWQLEVFMSERRTGHVTAARGESREPLEVEYVVATDPTRRLKGTLRAVWETAELHEEHGHSVRLLVDIDEGDVRDLRPGATVTARVHCGMRPLGYVWLHEVFEFIQSRILFHF